MYLYPAAANPDDTIPSAWLLMMDSLIFTPKWFQLAHPISGDLETTVSDEIDIVMKMQKTITVSLVDNDMIFFIKRNDTPAKNKFILNMPVN